MAQYTQTLAIQFRHPHTTVQVCDVYCVILCVANNLQCHRTFFTFLSSLKLCFRFFFFLNFRRYNLFVCCVMTGATSSFTVAIFFIFIAHCIRHWCLVPKWSHCSYITKNLVQFLVWGGGDPIGIKRVYVERSAHNDRR